MLTDEYDNPQEAIVLYKTLLEDQTEVLKKNHPDTLTTLANIASWKHQHGEPDALELAKEVLEFRMKKPCRRHPETLESLRQVISGQPRNGTRLRIESGRQRCFETQSRYLAKTIPSWSLFAGPLQSGANPISFQPEADLRSECLLLASRHSPSSDRSHQNEVRSRCRR